MLKALKSNIFQKISYLLNKWKYQNTWGQNCPNSEGYVLANVQEDLKKKPKLIMVEIKTHLNYVAI